MNGTEKKVVDSVMVYRTKMLAVTDSEHGNFFVFSYFLFSYLVSPFRVNFGLH